MKTIKPTRNTLLFLIALLIILIHFASSCQKQSQTRPGEVNYCVKCKQADTCGTLDALNAWEKQNHYTDCIYKPKN